MEKRCCAKCKIEYPKTEKYFYKRYGRLTGLNSYCKKCFCIIQSEKHADIKKKMLEYRGGKCVVCGYDRRAWNLAFHHLDPSKKEIKIGETRRVFNAALMEELDKCVVMCSICHTDTHRGEHPEYLKFKVSIAQLVRANAS